MFAENLPSIYMWELLSPFKIWGGSFSRWDNLGGMLSAWKFFRTTSYRTHECYHSITQTCFNIQWLNQTYFVRFWFCSCSWNARPYTLTMLRIYKNIYTFTQYISDLHFHRISWINQSLYQLKYHITKPIANVYQIRRTNKPSIGWITCVLHNKLETECNVLDTTKKKKKFLFYLTCIIMLTR